MNLLLDPSSKRSNSKFQCTISIQVWITTCGIKGNKAFFFEQPHPLRLAMEERLWEGWKGCPRWLGSSKLLSQFFWGNHCFLGLYSSLSSSQLPHTKQTLLPVKTKVFWWHWHVTGPAAQWGCKPLALPACSLWCWHSAQKSRYNWVSLKS